MPITTDLNISPYFDDYDPNKNYHRVLFRPSVPVQARELTQLQTILQDQIEKFGDWAFKNGDIVSGCESIDQPSVPYVRLKNFASNSSSDAVPFDATAHVNHIIVDETTGLEAIIMYANNGFVESYPNTNVLYLKYKGTGQVGTGTGAEFYPQFTNNSMLRIKTYDSLGNPVWLANIYTYANSATNHVTTGNAHGIVFSAGVVYLNGNFVRVEDSTFGIVNSFGTNAGNNVVGFILEEKIITENDDDTLLDNALGYPNENAPGSHRLKLIPRVISVSPSELPPIKVNNVSEELKNFNPVGRYNYNSYVSKVTQGSNLFSIVGEVVHKRTYEESGNYVVMPFMIDPVTNTGDANVAPENSNSFLSRVSSGVGYALGSRVELLKSAYANMRRGTTTRQYNEQQITFSYGNYFVLNEVAGTFDCTKAESVDLYSKVQKAVSDRQFSSLTPEGTKIGTAKVRCFSFGYGIPGTAAANYLLHVFDISLLPGYNTNEIKSVYYNGTNKGVGDVVGTLQGSQNKQQLYSFGTNGIKTLRDANGNLNTQYEYRTKQTAAISTSGLITVVLTSGDDVLPYGTTISLPNYEATNFTVVVNENRYTANLTQTVSVSTSSNVVVGSSTLFTGSFDVGDQIKVGSDIRTITSIANNINLTVDAPFSSTASGLNYQKAFLKGKILNLSNLGTNILSNIQIVNSKTFTIDTKQPPANDGSSNVTIPVDVFFNVLKNNAVPSKKEIRKNRFVKINTTTNPTGPWCLGFSDVHKITAVYANTGAAEITSPDLIDDFVFDPGQFDTHYGLAYLYPKNGKDARNLNLLVKLDYFQANLATGVGFFSIDSYPIDDVYEANTEGIQTKDIPLYVTESGSKVPLRDVVDFRIPANNTATDATSPSSASVNPSSTLTLKIDPTNGIDTPSYGKNFESDYVRYLPRKDLIMISPDNVLRVKEGSSGDFPQNPQFPENAMTLAVVNIPPYPSLTSDQVNEFLTLNRRSKTLCRDTSYAISSNIMTNRRYTMKDIGTLDKRITNLEYYTQLSLLEKQAKDLTVTDANGLDRFKNGIFVDPFTSHILGDVSNPEYCICIDTSKGIARPKIVREVFKIEFDQSTSTNVKQTGRLVTLDYIETSYLLQPFATKFRSAALVAYAWNGKCTLVPPYDNHMDDVNTGSINITIDNATPWQEFAQGPMGQTWGDWVTTTEVTSNTVTTGTVNNINFQASGLRIGGSVQQNQQLIINAVKAEAARNGIDPNLVEGNLTVNYDGQITRL